MGGGLASFLPYKVKKIGWDTMAKIRHAVLGDGTTKTPKTSQSAPGTVAVGEPSVDKTTNELIIGLENNLTNGILSLADVKANVHSMLPHVKAQIYRKHPEWAYSQGATSNEQPTHTEIGYTHIANSGVPEPETNSAVETGAYHNKYEKQGDPNVTGISPNDVRLRARKEALIAGTIPMSEHTENLEIVLGSKERAQNSIAENQNQYDQVSDWHKNR